ncbi:LacI family DNA-binding transcriptional regulator [Variovorax sp. E3]|nr:LacI family DNA-binding transcriptional regulator [Variovorax sp. E3]
MSTDPSPRANIKDVAREAGVSPTTVSHALTRGGRWMRKPAHASRRRP